MLRPLRLLKGFRLSYVWLLQSVNSIPKNRTISSTSLNTTKTKKDDDGDRKCRPKWSWPELNRVLRDAARDEFELTDNKPPVKQFEWLHLKEYQGCRSLSSRSTYRCWVYSAWQIVCHILHIYKSINHSFRRIWKGNQNTRFVYRLTLFSCSYLSTRFRLSAIDDSTSFGIWIRHRLNKDESVVDGNVSACADLLKRERIGQATLS